MERKMILVTGATGNVGKHLVGRLIDTGAQVRVLIRDERKAAGIDNRIELALGNLDKPETLIPAMRGVNRLYLVTPVTQQVINLTEAAKQAGVEHIVKQSTIEADRYLGPGKWHREQEELIKASGSTWTFLRPTLMMVNVIEWWAATIKSHDTVYFPGGKGKVAPIDPQDVASVACNVLTHPEHEGHIYELTGPEAYTIKEMVQILGRVLGRPLRYMNVPGFLAPIGMRRFGMSDDLVKGLIETLGALHRNEYAYVTDAVERVGGYKPRTFESWCQDYISAF